MGDRLRPAKLKLLQTMSFFDSNSYFIDEKVGLFKFENCYKVFDDNGLEIGSINQKLSAGAKLLRLFVNKAMLPFKLEIKDAEGQLQATVSRGWTFFLSKIIITDANEEQVGSIKQKFKFFKPKFTILDNSEQVAATIKGDWKAWNFDITDAAEKSIGTIDKKWNGAMKEIFTSADKYHVKINPEYSNPASKMAVIAGAITIDMVLKESK